MTHIRLLILIISLSFFSFAKAGENITAKDLAGNWKMTDVKITNHGAANPVTKDNCYLCDLYKAKLGLVFTLDGKVNYTNYGNSNSVRYTINGNVLSMFSEETNQAQGKREDFILSLSDNVLTLTRIYPEFTETYTLTK
jgi:hypothetical protein